MIQSRAKSLHLELLRTKMILELFGETHLDPQLLHSRSEARVGLFSVSGIMDRRDYLTVAVVCTVCSIRNECYVTAYGLMCRLPAKTWIFMASSLLQALVLVSSLFRQEAAKQPRQLSYASLMLAVQVFRARLSLESKEKSQRQENSTGKTWRIFASHVGQAAQAIEEPRTIKGPSR